MDADDISEPERLTEQVAFLEAHPDHVAVGCAVQMIDDVGNVTGERMLETEATAIEERLLLGYGNAIPHPGLMLRRTTMDKVEGYREQFVTAQDLDLYLRLARVGKLANLPAFLLRYRRHGEAIGSLKVEQQFRDVRAILNDAYADRSRELPREVIDRWRRLVADRLMSQSRSPHHTRSTSTAVRLAARAIWYTPMRRSAWINVLRLSTAYVWPRRWRACS